MNIYLIEQGINNDYETYDSAVVVAESEEKARRIHPNGTILSDDTEVVNFGFFDEKCWVIHSWVGLDDIDEIKVTLIGKARKDLEEGLVVASYHAG